MSWQQRKPVRTIPDSPAGYVADDAPGQAATADATSARALAGDVWLTKDGRELRIDEMFRPHLGNAQAVISNWLKREKDPLKRRELKSWRTRMRRELVKREKAWRKKRKNEVAD